MAKIMKGTPRCDIVVHGTSDCDWNRLLTENSYCLVMMLVKSVSCVMMISRNLHRNINTLDSTHCTCSERLMQETLDEVKLS